MLLSAAGGAYWPLATHRCPFLEPFPSAGCGAHRPLTNLCPPSPRLAYPDPPPYPSSPLVGCANGAPGLSLFHCSVSSPHRGGQLPLLLTRCVHVDTPDRRWGRPPQRRLMGPRMSTYGVTSPTGAHNNLPPGRSRTQSSLWRAHHVPTHPPLVSVVCVLCVHPLAWHGCHPGWWVGGGVE